VGRDAMPDRGISSALHVEKNLSAAAQPLWTWSTSPSFSLPKL